MFCEQCGSPRQTYALFCEQCGAPFPMDSATQLIPPNGMNMYTPIPPSPFYGYQSPEQLFPTQFEGNPMNSGIVEPGISPALQVDFIPNPIQEYSAPEHKPWTKLHTLLIVFMIIISACLYNLYQIGLTMSDPLFIIESYIEAKSIQDYDTLTKLFDNNISNASYKNIYNQPILDVEVLDMEYTIDEVWSDYMTISFAYQYPNTKYRESGTFSLYKSSKNKWVFFDNWVIDSDTAVTTDFRISGPGGSEITIGGVNIADIATDVTTNTDTASYSYGTVSYTMPPMISGTYIVTVTFPYGDTFEKAITVKPNGYGHLSFDYLDSSYEERVDEIVDIMEIYLDYYIKDLEYDDLMETLADISDGMATIDSFEYGWSKRSLDYRYTPESYEISNIVVKANNPIYDTDLDSIMHTFTIYADTYTKGFLTKRDDWSKVVTGTYEQEYEQSLYMSISLIYHNDKWVVNELSAPTIR